MDVSLATTLVFAKTPKGVAEINARSGALTLQARRVLIMIDGRRPIAELLAVVRTGEFEGIMSTLEQQGMIEKVDVIEDTRNFEDDDFADTISLLEENAAALRSMPDMSAAAIAQATGRGDPHAAHAPEAASANAAAIAARAVANASAPRKPATIASPMQAPVQEMAVGKARPGTVNVVVRSSEPPRPVTPPPTVRAALVADAGNLAVAAPARAPATVVQPAPAPAPAPQPSATNARTLEEEKRYVVSALYSVLGPYGEHSVAMLMECKTMDAFREQVKAAGKRVVTFRGERASQDFMKSIGYA